MSETSQRVVSECEETLAHEHSRVAGEGAERGNGVAEKGLFREVSVEPRKVHERSVLVDRLVLKPILG